MNVVGPPSILLSNLTVAMLALAAYYLGVFIRKRAFPGPSSLSFRDQALLGIPFALAVVAAMGPVILKTMTDFTVLATFGVIIEQGMLLNETATERLRDLGTGNRG